MLFPNAPALRRIGLGGSTFGREIGERDALWDAGAETAAALIALDQLRRAGRVHALGVSNFTADQPGQILGRQAQFGVAPFRALQNCNNLAVREVDPRTRKLCATRRRL